MANEVQRFYWGSQSSPVATADVEAGTFTLTFESETTGELAFDANAATIEAALEALSTIGAGNVSVTLETNGFSVEFVGALANTDVALIAFTEGSTPLKQRADTITVNETQAGAADTWSGVSVDGNFSDGDDNTVAAVQSFTVSPLVPERGSWNFNGNSCAFDETPANPSDWTVDGVLTAGSMTVTKNDVSSGQSPFSYDSGTLEYLSAAGSPNITEVWLPDEPTEGGLLLSDAGLYQTSEWTYNAEAAVVEAAIQAITGGYPCLVTGSGTTADPWIITSEDNRSSPGWMGVTNSNYLRKAASAEIVEITAGTPAPSPPAASANRHATLIGG